MKQMYAKYPFNKWFGWHLPTESKSSVFQEQKRSAAENETAYRNKVIMTGRHSSSCQTLSRALTFQSKEDDFYLLPDSEM